MQWTARAALQSVSSLGDMGILSDSGYCSSFSRFQNAQPKLKMGQKAQTKVCLSHCYYIAFGLRQGCYGRLAVVTTPISSLDWDCKLVQANTRGGGRLEMRFWSGVTAWRSPPDSTVAASHKANEDSLGSNH